MTPYIKTIARSIRQSFGRFLAILAIIALGVGFMCGLMQSNPSFILTGNTYIAERKMFDFRLLSTIGFDEEDIEKIAALDGIVDAEGAYSADVVARLSSQEETSRSQVRIHSLTTGVNLLKVEAGRLPENGNEIVVDGYFFADPDEVIGTQLILSGAAGQDDADYLNSDVFTVVGTVRSPLYIDFQRGTTDVGSGQLTYFAYTTGDAFDMEYYTECYVYYDTGLDAYSDEYEDFAETKEDELETAVAAIIDERFQELMDENRADLADGIAELEDARVEASADLDDARDELSDAHDELQDAWEQLEGTREQLEALPMVPPQYQEAYDEALAEYEDGLSEYEDGRIEYYEGLRDFDAQMTAASMELSYMSGVLANTEDPDVYVLGRNTNTGYLAFDNDAGIVKGLANVFPIFFFALAALVCSTTMQRMVMDERSIIGTMRALGYTDMSIIMKYSIYAGSAAVIGAVAGYYAGINLFPSVIWDVYGMMYGFSDIMLQKSVPLFIVAIAVSLLCSVGVAVVTAADELRGMPAELIRPKAPAAGKKIFLEKMTGVWKRLRFTEKVSLRNVFRFKKRMSMMIIGIAGCSALLITGFGIRDSITDVVDLQYDNITTYRLDALLKDGKTEQQALDDIEDANALLGTSYRGIPVRTENVTHTSSQMVRDVTLFISSDPSVNDALKASSDGVSMPWPGDGQIAISSKLAEKNDLHPGDMITLGYGDEGREFTLRIAYVFDNYIFHYAFINEATYEDVFAKAYRASDILIVNDVDEDSLDYDMSRELNLTNDFTDVRVTAESRVSFANTMEKMNLIVILIIGCAAALAFIVLFNLNNINISERVREIATIKVLGFSQAETGAYFFRENFILVFMGYIVGIPLGIALHRFVIDKIEMDMVTFECKIIPISYLYSILFVILFSIIVDLVMRIKINRIDMAESLKSAE